jgi:hypothetical protein
MDIQELKLDFPSVVERGLSMAGLYLEAALRVIDKICGDGFAKSNPIVTAAFMLAAGIDHHGVLIAQQVRQGLREIGPGCGLPNELSDICGELGELTGATRQVAHEIEEKWIS